MARLIRPTLESLLLAMCALAAVPSSLQAQSAAKPAAQAPAPKTPARPAARPPARSAAPAPAPAPAPAAAKAAEPAPPPKPVAQDLRMKTVYSTGNQKTESVTFIKGERERFEFGDMVLLKQHDLKRTVQITRAANTYLLVPDGAAPAIPGPLPTPAVPAAKPGVVTMTTTVADTGERKTAFGMQARHVKMTIDRQPAPGACDPSKQHIETDGWYVDLPALIQAAPEPGAPAPPGGCVDELKITQNGDPKALGFPIGYSTTISGEDGKPNVVAMEVTELEVRSLDAALFEIPAGMNEAGNIRALSQAVSDANETRLAEALTAPSPGIQKTPGVPLIGVQEVINRTTQQVDPRVLRDRLVTELDGVMVEATPLAGSQSDLLQLAAAKGFDYVLIAEITDLKVSKGGGLGGVLKAATKVAGGGSGQDPTEAAVSVKLVQPDGKARLSSTVKGKDGGGFDMKTGLGVAKFAGTMYMNMMTGKMMMNALNSSMTGNLGGMGMLGNPALMNAQTSGLGMGSGMGAGMRMGMDPTAGAASFLIQQALSSDATASGAAGQGPSFDAALGDAFKEAAKTVSENLKKTEQKKK